MHKLKIMEHISLDGVIQVPTVRATATSHTVTGPRRIALLLG
jgi:hypothetical protein